ncbi:hypothetical protein ACFWJW_34545 [Streptomyces sp. NPDC127097]|uniref:hypothetical protein n=1 Tax=Streptomyces sp. NPDC127097 TaxID=3347136 RepID=UPI0036512D60
MTDKAAIPAATRTVRVISVAALGVAVAYTGIWGYVCFPQLTALAATHDVVAPPVVALMAMAGPALFWGFIGLRLGTSRLGWAAGFALTGILIALTYAYLADQSTGHGFNYWLFLTLLVACSLVAFCVTPYALVRATVRRP